MSKTRIAYDTIGGNAFWVKKHLADPDIMFFYGTGSPNVQWTKSEISLFPPAIMVEIDQGGMGTPKLDAVVRDIENGAWTPGAAVDKTGWNVERPTLYCVRDTLPQVVADKWQGDVWLAWPGWKGEALPRYPGITFVAVQSGFFANYDSSVIIDPYWPHKTPADVYDSGFSLTIFNRTASLAFNAYPGADSYHVLYRPDGQPTATTIATISPPPARDVEHIATLTIPGSHGGELQVIASLAGTVKLIVAHPLP